MLLSSARYWSVFDDVKRILVLSGFTIGYLMLSLINNKIHLLFFAFLVESVYISQFLSYVVFWISALSTDLTDFLYIRIVLF